MSERESPRPLDPRLEGIRGALARRIANDALAPQLVRSGLIDEEKDILVSPLTEEGLEMLLKSLVYGVEMVLWNTQLRVPPDASLDELSLVERMVAGLGECQVEVEEQTLKVRFSGEDVVITKIHVPLEGDQAVGDQEKPICLVDFRRILIYADSIYG